MRVSIAYLAKVAAWSELPRAQVMTSLRRPVAEQLTDALESSAGQFLTRDGFGRFRRFAEHERRSGGGCLGRPAAPVGLVVGHRY